MNLIIDFDSIGDSSKKALLLETLRKMNVGFETAEKKQTLEEYNLEIEEAEAEIERGEFTTAEELKKQVDRW